MLSKYVYQIKRDDVVCFYHSLNNIPLYLNETEVALLNNYLTSGEKNQKNEHIIELFEESGFLVKSNLEDDKFFDSIKENLPKPALTTAYFVLTENCNMACRYCFLGNAVSDKCFKEKMSKDLASKCFEYFVNQSSHSGVPSSTKRNVVFYGGEPLLGFDTIKHIVELYHEYKKQNKISFEIDFSIVTNGTLINKDIAAFFAQKNISVSLSLDGPSEEANKNRVLKDGTPAYDKITNAITILNEVGCEFGISLTLSDSALDIPCEFLVEFLLKNNIYAVNLNTMIYASNFTNRDDYYYRATQYVIDFWKCARNVGIYEDRIMRKLKAFIEQKFYYSDCAATSGSQIVFDPTGKIGICHGKISSKETFEFSINNKVNLNKEPLFEIWTHNSPIMRNECKKCIAIGICGGGCPLNAKFDEETNAVLDKGFCIHTKKILDFMIWDLYEKMIEG